MLVVSLRMDSLPPSSGPSVHSNGPLVPEAALLYARGFLSDGH